MFIDAIKETTDELIYLSKTLKSFAQAFSKACRSRATPLSLSAESEIPLGEAQHFFFLISGFYPPINFFYMQD